MQQFLLLLKGKGALDYTPDELQSRLDEYHEWVKTIGTHYVSDNRLERTGAHIKSKTEIITDGPFLETKEIIGGFVIIQAEDLDQATTIATSSPLLKYFEIIVRPVVA